MNLIVPVLAAGAYFLYSTSKDGEALQKCEILRFKIGSPSIKLQETIFPVTLEIFNPNRRNVSVEYFRGNVYRGTIKLGDFTFNNTDGAAILTGRMNTPVTFNVRIPTTGLVSNVVNIVKNLLNSTPIETTIRIDAIISLGGLTVPVNFNYDLKKNAQVAGIGKPYAKFEFDSNEQMEKYLSKDCRGHLPKPSLNGVTSDRFFFKNIEFGKHVQGNKRNDGDWQIFLCYGDPNDSTVVDRKTYKTKAAAVTAAKKYLSKENI